MFPSRFATTEAQRFRQQRAASKRLRCTWRMGRIRASLVLMAWIAAGLAGPDSAWAADPVSFRREVAPLLVGRCLGCHNDEKTEAALNLKTFALLRAGGVTLGAGILEPGDPEASHLIAVLKPDANPRMPLQQAPLSEPEIALLERWVREGATFDGGSETETLLTSLVDPLANLPKVSPRRPVHPPIKALAVAPGGQRRDRSRRWFFRPMVTNLLSRGVDRASLVRLWSGI